MAVNDHALPYTHPLYDSLVSVPGLGVGVTSIDRLLTWGAKNSLWVFPMATSCCGIEFMAAAASRVDLDRMGTIVRGTPRQADVMVVAGTITVKMAPRVRRLWDQMPEPKWCVAMGSCAISGDFYRNLYATVPGIDTFLPVDVYIPGCPPNPEAVMHGLMRLQEKIAEPRDGTRVEPDTRPELFGAQKPCIPSLNDPARPVDLTDKQTVASLASEPETEAGGGTRLPILRAPIHDRRLAPEGDLNRWLKDEFGATEAPGLLPLISIDRHFVLAAALKNLGYRLLVYVAALHRPEKAAVPESYEVSVGLRTVGPNSRYIAWRVSIPVHDEVPSLTAIFAGADWQEREQYDLVGVRFSDHPDLRRIMLAEDFVGHPLRRDYASNTSVSPWR